jgi:hypothetical protein
MFETTHCTPFSTLLNHCVLWSVVLLLTQFHSGKLSPEYPRRLPLLICLVQSSLEMYATNRSRSWCILSVLFTIGSLTNFVTAIKLYPSPASLPSQVPAGCRAALSTDITCGPRFILASDLVREIPFNNTFLGDYCSSACSTSFISFTTNINTRCGNTVYDFGYNNNKTGNDLIAPLKWARDMACLTGTSPIDYCLPKIHNHTVGYCDDCTLKYFAGMLSNAAGARVISEKGFSSIASSCNVSPTKYPHSTITIPKPPPA